MQWEWLKTGISPLKDLLTFLNKESKTSDVLKKQVIRELRNNLNIFHNAFLKNVEPDMMIDMLANEAVKEAIRTILSLKSWKPEPLSLIMSLTTGIRNTPAGMQRN